MYIIQVQGGGGAGRPFLPVIGEAWFDALVWDDTWPPDVRLLSQPSNQLDRQAARTAHRLAQKRNQTKEKAKIVAAVWVAYLNAVLVISHLAGVGGVVWCGVNLMIIPFSEASIPPNVCSSIHPFPQSVLVLKSLPQTAAKPLLSLLPDSSSMPPV